MRLDRHSHRPYSYLAKRPGYGYQKVLERAFQKLTTTVSFSVLYLKDSVGIADGTNKEDLVLAADLACISCLLVDSVPLNDQTKL